MVVAGLLVAGVVAGGCQRGGGSPGAAPPGELEGVTTTTAPAISTTMASTSTTAVTTTTTTTPPPPPPPPAPAPVGGLATVVRTGDTTRSSLALTFDAGSDAGNTAGILDLLASRGLRASFGVTGRWVEANPDLARRIVAEGHLVFNHTRDHQSFTGRSTGKAPLSRDQRIAELRDAADSIQRVTGVPPGPWFRPPYGDYDRSVQADVLAAGYPLVVMWSTDSLGWQGLDPPALTARVLRGAEPGAIILFHVGAASTDAAALPAILDGLRDRNLRPVTIAELIGG
jgi:peptidoglycan/xylan/chitin deacetylase (PgdA/CDA1 family)